MDRVAPHKRITRFRLLFQYIAYGRINRRPRRRLRPLDLPNYTFLYFFVLKLRLSIRSVHYDVSRAGDEAGDLAYRKIELKIDQPGPRYGATVVLNQDGTRNAVQPLPVPPVAFRWTGTQNMTGYQSAIIPQEAPPVIRHRMLCWF